MSLEWSTVKSKISSHEVHQELGMFSQIMNKALVVNVN